MESERLERAARALLKARGVDLAECFHPEVALGAARRQAEHALDGFAGGDVLVCLTRECAEAFVSKSPAAHALAEREIRFHVRSALAAVEDRADG